MTSLKIVATSAEKASQLQFSLPAVIYKKIEDQGYKPIATTQAAGLATVFGLHPKGGTYVLAESNVITIELQGTDLDEAEVFANVLTDVLALSDVTSAEVIE